VSGMAKRSPCNAVFRVEPHLGAAIGGTASGLAGLIERRWLYRFVAEIDAIDYLAVALRFKAISNTTPRPPTSIFTLTGLSSRIILATRPATSIVSRP
jgi:hypothetical protein